VSQDFGNHFNQMVSKSLTLTFNLVKSSLAFSAR